MSLGNVPRPRPFASYRINEPERVVVARRRQRVERIHDQLGPRSSSRPLSNHAPCACLASAGTVACSRAFPGAPAGPIVIGATLWMAQRCFVFARFPVPIIPSCTEAGDQRRTPCDSATFFDSSPYPVPRPTHKADSARLRGKRGARDSVRATISRVLVISPVSM
jgi:hypothetical protein